MYQTQNNQKKMNAYAQKYCPDRRETIQLSNGVFGIEMGGYRKLLDYLMNNCFTVWAYFKNSIEGFVFDCLCSLVADIRS